MVSSHIFRSYDIRGVYKKDLDEKTMEGIGNVLGQFVKGAFAVGMDMRNSSKGLHDALIEGITAKRDVHDLGLVPMGAAMFYALNNKLTLAYVTASHLPREWNGVKFFHPDGMGFPEEENFIIRDMFLENRFIDNKKGKISIIDSDRVINDYKDYLFSRLKIKKGLSVVIDCGNGMAGLIAPKLFSRLGCEVFAIFDELNGNFPNRNPEPMDDSVSRLKEEVKKRKADIGIAFDGDADRMLIIDDMSRTVTPEKAAYLILSELLKKERGPIVANIECTKAIDDVAKKFKRKVFRVRVGHPYLVQGAKKMKACFGLESSGHFVLPSIVPFDDALPSSLFAVQVLSNLDRKLSAFVDDIPKYYFERVNFECNDEKKFEIIEGLKQMFLKKYDNINYIDGVRVEFEDGWALVRASNTGPLIRLTVEGETKEAFDKIKKDFTGILTQALAAS